VFTIAIGDCRAVKRRGAMGHRLLSAASSASKSVRLWAEEILRAAGHDAELLRVRDAALPPDLAMTAFEQPLLGSPQKAHRVGDCASQTLKASPRASGTRSAYRVRRRRVRASGSSHRR
jgi:hypothetical protein